MTSLLAQIRIEIVLTLRRGESLLLVLGLPLAFLVFFSKVSVLSTGSQSAVDFLAPGILALAVMSTAMVSLSIATGFERSYGVLKRLGATPLGRPRLIAAKTAGVVAVELVQLVILVPVAYSLGWSPHPGWTGAVGGVVLGTVAFAGLGLVLARSLRAEVNLAASNALYLVLLLISGMMFDLGKLPSGVRQVARLLPSAALTEVLRGSLDGAGVAGRAWLTLALWAVLTPLGATRLFHWE